MRITETEAELQVRVTAALDVAQIHRDRILAAMDYLSTRFPQTSQELIDADYTGGYVDQSGLLALLASVQHTNGVGPWRTEVLCMACALNHPDPMGFHNTWHR